MHTKVYVYYYSYMKQKVEKLNYNGAGNWEEIFKLGSYLPDEALTSKDINIGPPNWRHTTTKVVTYSRCISNLKSLNSQY